MSAQCDIVSPFGKYCDSGGNPGVRLPGPGKQRIEVVDRTIGNPNDAWWKELTGRSGNGSRFVRGPGLTNLWAREVSAAVKATASFDSWAAFSALANVRNGHRNTGFAPNHSYVWGVHYLIHRINTTAGRPMAAVTSHAIGWSTVQCRTMAAASPTIASTSSGRCRRSATSSRRCGPKRPRSSAASWNRSQHRPTRLGRAPPDTAGSCRRTEAPARVAGQVRGGLGT